MIKRWIERVAVLAMVMVASVSMVLILVTRRWTRGAK